MKNTTSRLSRRHLIKTATAFPFAAVGGSAANSAVAVGLLGSGGRGTRLASYLVQDPNARLVALCDLFDDRIERAKARIPVEHPKVYKDYHELLASDVDAVIIATPVFLHPEHLEAAVKAKKHIYIEKPAAADVEGCKRVMRAADSADPRLNISFGFQQRYGPNYHAAKKLADEGALGRMHMGHALFIKGPVTGKEEPVPRPQNEMERIRYWKHWRETYGDIIVETYCHSIDVLNWFLGGRPSRAHGSGGRTIRRTGDMMDHVNVTFDYADNVQACLTGSHIAPPFYREVWEQFFGAKTSVRTAREFWTYFRSKDGVETKKSPRDITHDAIEQFVARIRDGRTENTGVRGAESTLTAIMGRMAIDLQRPVSWDEMMRT